MPGHYVPGGGLSRTAHERRAMPHGGTGHGGTKMAEFISWAGPPLICLLRPWIVLIKGVKEYLKYYIYIYSFFLHYC